MPEGPEVKRCSDLMRDVLEGETIMYAAPGSGKLQRLGVPGLQQLILPAKVADVYTKGKLIILELEREQYMLSTLGMSGWWYPPAKEILEGITAYYAGKLVKASAIIEKALKHTRFKIQTESGKLLHYVDPRNFGNLKFVTAEEAQKAWDAIGPDLMQRTTDFTTFHDQITKHPGDQIGALLLNQAVISGLGNIYRAETLYQAKVSPYRLVRDISTDELRELFTAARRALYEGYIGTIQHAVYSRARTPAGEEVARAESAGRTIWYAPSVQK